MITKLNLINAGTEARITRLANSCGRTKLTLGLFVLKTPSPTELKAEIWDRLIERELPKVREDIRRLLREKNEELDEFGTERKSPNQIRMFLTKIGTNYYNVIQAGVDGSYGGRDTSFFEIREGQSSVLLRATIHMENGNFSDYIRHERNYCDTQPLQIYDQTRGQELPGNYNQALLAELFHLQSLRWAQIAGEHIVVVAKIVSRFVNAALTYAIKDGKVRENIGRLVSTTLEANTEAAEHELEKILGDKTRQPITYNHYYTDNIQNARNEASKASLKTRACFKLLSSLKKRVIVDMKEQACSEAKTDLTAYYKVARKTFVDNACRQVIERHIFAKLADEFSPMTFSFYVFGGGAY
ncbi:Dynamin [Penicillium samsonianum]|uniref:Dynamin n=1 Tax=Penicillium samsonianum TaxID=1882272 RepID=UPI00254929B1|nr:Dynamin [Penicillium samsonianum]KAJ6118893.1 Dynamin [Penicillium samsonianum]